MSLKLKMSVKSPTLCNLILEKYSSKLPLTIGSSTFYEGDIDKLLNMLSHNFLKCKKREKNCIYVTKVMVKPNDLAHRESPSMFLDKKCD